MGTWQENMTAIAKDPAKVASEIARATAVASSGKGTDATTRYINQLNALKDGASLTKVMSGQYDNYKPDKSFSADYRDKTSYNPTYPDPGVNAYNLGMNGPVGPAPVQTDPSSYHVDYTTGKVNGGGGAGFGTTADAMDDMALRINNTVATALDGITPDWMKFVQENGVVIVGGLLSTVLLMKVFGKS